MPSQGGEPQLMADLFGDDSYFQDWTRDGHYMIVFKADVSGGSALYLLPINDGKPTGKPIFVRYGEFQAGETKASGAFVYAAHSQAGSFTTWIGKLNPIKNSVAWEKLSLSRINASSPAWSPDSTRIAYTARNFVAGRTSLLVRNFASGEERELYEGNVGNCLWSASNANISCVLRGERNLIQVLSISAETGHAEPLGTVPEGLKGATPRLLTRDDRAIYLTSAKLGLVRWEIGAPSWTTVCEGPDYAWPSPDERWVARSEKGKIEIRPMSGGDWRPLAPDTPAAVDEFTSDGNWLLYTGLDVSGRDGLFRVATSGGQPERLGDLPSTNKLWDVRISPDGQTVFAYFDAGNPLDLWMLENFEPKQQAAK